jgi:hypothetical protein
MEIAFNAKGLQNRLKILWTVKIAVTILLITDWIIDIENLSGAFRDDLDSV